MLATEGRRLSVLPLLGVLAIATVLVLLGATNHGLWDDEANTAMFARNWLAQSKLSGWDGTNLVGYNEGAELDSKLLNVYMPPAQFFVAAAGIKLFGLTTLGVRLPFIVIGLATLVLLAYVSRWHFESRVPSWLGPLLLAVSPAYLMFTRQCRYYALVSWFTVLLLAGHSYPKHTRRALVGSLVAGGFGMAGLMWTQYLPAAAMAAALPCFLLLERYRNRTQYLYLGVVYATLLVVGVYVFVTANPFSANVLPPGPLPKALRLLLLTVWHFTGPFRYEFFPTLVPLSLGVLWWLERRQGRPNALLREGWVLCLVLAVYSLSMVPISPQTVRSLKGSANMRYLIALMPIGALATSVTLTAIGRYRGRWSRTLAALGALGIVFTNLFSSLGWSAPRSTLVVYVLENFRKYKTGNELIVEYLKTLPKGKVIQVRPAFMAYPAMFYVPEHHYRGQLSEHHALTSELRRDLPDYVYPARVMADYVLLGEKEEPERFEREHLGQYRRVAVLGADCRDKSRPEIPWHSFGPPSDPKGGCVVFERVK